MHGAQKHLFECTPHSPQNCTCPRACAPVQRRRNLFAMETIANCLESCANISRLSFAARLATVSTKSVARRCSLKKLSKSTLAHDAVNAVVSHKHHSIIRVGAGLIQFVYIFQCFINCKRTNNANNATHYVKLGKNNREFHAQLL